MMKAAATSVAPAVADAGAAVAAPAPAPAPTPNYTPPPTAMPPAPTSMDTGGATPRSGGIKEFFSDVNVVDVAISAFIVGAVIYSIQYHKFMMMLEKTGYADLSTRIQRIESAMASAAKKQTEANAAGNGRIRRKRGVITL